MKGNTISECDLITLFGWLIETPSIERVMIPFRASKDRNGQGGQRPDPFQQLTDELALPEELIRQCKSVRSINQQPGRLGVALALEIKRFLEQHHPKALVGPHKKRLRGGIERIAQKNGWPAEPFNGLDNSIQTTIRARYQSSNAEFCRCFWPEMTWNELFRRLQNNGEPSSTAWTKTADADLKACRAKVIASNLPISIVAEIPR